MIRHSISPMRRIGPAVGCCPALLAVVLVIAMPGCGCDRPSSPVVEPLGAAPAKALEAATPADEVTAGAEPPVQQEPAPLLAATTIESESPVGAGKSNEAAAESSPLAEQEKPESQPRDESVVLFTPQGPLVVQLSIKIDDQPQRALAERLLRALVTLGGATSEREAKWGDLLAHPVIAQGQWGNAPLASDKDREEAIEQFDANRDDLVQPGELAALLMRNPSSGKAFSVQTELGTGEGVQDVPVFALLDVDRDGRLTAAELSGAAARLRERDANDDGIVTLSDLRPPRDPQEAPSGRPDDEPDLGFDLADVPADILFYTLGEWYDVGDGLDREALRLLPGAIDRLDENADGVVDAREIAALGQSTPALQLQARFALRQPGQAAIELQSLHESLKAAGASYRADRAARGLLQLGQGGVELSAVDAAPSTDVAVGQQFALFDSDRSGQVEAAEQQTFLALAGASLAECDRDGDGKLSLEECRPKLIELLPYPAMQVQLTIGRAEDGLFTWLDVQRDQRLTARELAAVGARLAELDRDGNGEIWPDEVPSRLSCVVSRGATNRQVSREMAPPQVAPASNAPAWMTAMDRNRDGELSHREFLGTAAQFKLIDADGDGFISIVEANAAASGDAP